MERPNPANSKKTVPSAADPKRFWNTVSDIENNPSLLQPIILSVRVRMADLFPHHLFYVSATPCNAQRPPPSPPTHLKSLSPSSPPHLASPSPIWEGLGGLVSPSRLGGRGRGDWPHHRGHLGEVSEDWRSLGTGLAL